LRRARTNSTEHDDRCGIETLSPQLGSKLPFKKIYRDVLLVGNVPRYQDCVEVGSPG
jgi:hypothetical protein